MCAWRDEADRGPHRGQDGREEHPPVPRVQLREALRERDAQQEREQHLHARQGHAQLVEQLDQLAVGPLTRVLPVVVVVGYLPAGRGRSHAPTVPAVAASDADAVPLAQALQDAATERVALVLGSEGHGLTPRWLASADVRARIPMAPGVDSLNIASAAAIACYLVASARR